MSSNTLKSTVRRLGFLCLGLGILNHSHGAVGQIANNFTLPYFDSQNLQSTDSFSLYDAEGSIVILEWFGWWCPFCPPAAQALHDQVLSNVGTQNANGVPVKHIALHVEGADVNGINNFIGNFSLEIVLMDVERSAFSQFSDVGTQPFFVVLNGVKNAEGIQQWEVLFEHNGYGGNSFPGGQMLQAINSVTLAPGSGEVVVPEVIPELPPEMDSVQPFLTLPKVEGLKTVGEGPESPWKLGKVWDVHYPYVYSFSVAESQKDLVDPLIDPLKGWVYFYPQLNTVGEGLLIYVFATAEWKWLPREKPEYEQNLTNPGSGISGWGTLPSSPTVPQGEELTAFLGTLVVPPSPPALGLGNPFQTLAQVDGVKDVVAAGYPSLGTVEDSRFPIVKSSVLGASQTGSSRGWIYVHPELSNLASGILAYLYDENRWAWFPSGTEPWGFRFSLMEVPGNGWVMDPAQDTTIPTPEIISSFDVLGAPEGIPVWGQGNPFLNIPLEDRVKNANGIAGQNFGWITDQRYPGVYRFEGVEDTTPEDRWMIFNDLATLVADGIWVPDGQASAVWFPLNGTGRSVSLDGKTGGIGGWMSSREPLPKPSLDEVNAAQLLEIPTVLAKSSIIPVFQGLLPENGIKDTSANQSVLKGLGWINDTVFPKVYSFKFAGEQVTEQTLEDGTVQTLPMENAGWFYVQTDLSSPEVGLLIYLYANQTWRWYPAGGDGWYFQLNALDSGNSGWSLFEIVEQPE